MIDLLDAVVDALITGPLKPASPALTAVNCAIQQDGSPPPRAPDFYISVMEDGVQTEGIAAQGDLNELQRLSIFISIRVGQVAADRFDAIYRRNAKGLKKAERQILNAIHGQQWVRQRANTLAASRDVAAGGSGQVAQYLTPLYYAGRSQTTLKGAEWSWEEGTKDSGWLVRQLPFIGGRMVSYIGSIT